MEPKIKQYFLVQYTNYDDSDWIEITRKFASLEDAKSAIDTRRLTNYSSIKEDYRIVLFQEIETVVFAE